MPRNQNLPNHKHLHRHFSNLTALISPANKNHSHRRIMVAAEQATDVSVIKDDDDLEEEEPGEVIESAPPLKVGEERVLSTYGLRKKLLKSGLGFETPELGDEATVHYVGTVLDGAKFESTRERGGAVTVKIGEGEVVKGLELGIVTMKKGEVALFTVPAELACGGGGVPPNAAVQFEVELISWISVVNVSKDGGIVKKILEKGKRDERPGDVDEVLVKYRATLVDGSIVAETLEDGIEFYLKDGHFCPALPKSIMTMRRGEKARSIVQPQYAFGEEGREADNGFHSIPPNSVLNIDVELVSFKPVIDVTSDGKVLKKIVKEGEGTFSAGDGATVTVSYIARLEDGTVFEKKGVDGVQPLEFITDEEQVIAGFDRAVATMKKGENAILTVHPDLGFGSVEVKRELCVVPPSSNIVFEVEMLNLIKERAPWEMSNQEKIEAAGRKKEEGNILFKEGKYYRAGKKYDKAADYVSEDVMFGDDELKLAKLLRVSSWLNGAACSLKLNDFQEAIKLCSKVLDVEFHNVKALYRRSQAYMETSDLFSAESDIKKALEIDSQNIDVKLIEKKLKQLKAESNKRDAKLYTNIFTKKLKVEKVDNEKQDGAEAMAAADTPTSPSPECGVLDGSCGNI